MPGHGVTHLPGRTEGHIPSPVPIPSSVCMLPIHSPLPRYPTTPGRPGRRRSAIRLFSPVVPGTERDAKAVFLKLAKAVGKGPRRQHEAGPRYCLTLITQSAQLLQSSRFITCHLQLEPISTGNVHRATRFLVRHANEEGVIMLDHFSICNLEVKAHS